MSAEQKSSAGVCNKAVVAPAAPPDEAFDASLEDISTKINDIQINQQEAAVSAGRRDSSAQTPALEISMSEAGDLLDRGSVKMREQSETISTLVEQLQQMASAYQLVCQERDHFEELTESLLQCLELEELRRKGLIPNDSDDDNDEAGDDDSSEAPATTAVETAAQTSQVASVTSSTTATTPAKEQQAEDGDIQTEVKKSDLLRLNNALLHQIYSLRHQIDDMKDALFYSDEESCDDDEDSSGSETARSQAPSKSVSREVAYWITPGKSELKDMMSDPEATPLSLDGQLALLSAHFQSQLNMIEQGYKNGIAELAKGEVICAESVFNETVNVSCSFAETKLQEREGVEQARLLKAPFDQKARKILAGCYGGLSRVAVRKCEPLQQKFWEGLAKECNEQWTPQDDGVDDDFYDACDT